jgi:TonB family protein
MTTSIGDLLLQPGNSVLTGHPLLFTGLIVAAAVWAAILGWNVFVKAGWPGWAALIPFYNAYVLLKIGGKSGWWLPLFFIPPPWNFLLNSSLVKQIGKTSGRRGAQLAVLMPLLHVVIPVHLLFLASLHHASLAAPSTAPDVAEARRDPPKSSTPVIRVGAQIQAAKVVSKVDPVYPAQAKAAGIAGRVVLDVTIAEDGHVQMVNPRQGDPLLAAAAAAAVRQWIYRPTRIAIDPGKPTTPVRVATTVSVTFPWTDHPAPGP